MSGVNQTKIGIGGASYDDSTVEWYTPPRIFEALGAEFDLDPCAPVGGVPWVPAAAHYSRVDDGLSQDWYGRVWLNPPYGREAGRWVDRLADHGDGIALVFTRTDAKWAQRALARVSAVCFVAGRLQFVDGTEKKRSGNNAANGSMLLAFGQECADIIAYSGLGVVFQ